MRRVQRLLAGLALVAAGCAPVPPAAPPKPSPAGAPDLDAAHYRDAVQRGAKVYGAEPGDSLVVVRVYRGGRLSKFGHDHVVSTRDVRGFIDADQGRGDFYVEVERLTVDDPAQRAAAGFESTPSESDIAGTRSNMLEKVLEADRFPFVALRVRAVEQGTLQGELVLHGVTRPLRIPAKVDAGAERLEVSGSFAINQTDFGIEPFSVLGGALTVQDRVDLSFTIRAGRMTDAKLAARPAP
ncbi:MAG TPA: YceI family protein [Burkholderiales bacterium]|nr:YceI family protein [Burkholderiales bacterium]